MVRHAADLNIGPVDLAVGANRDIAGEAVDIGSSVVKVRNLAASAMFCEVE
jgi:hypothetical protein